MNETEPETVIVAQQDDGTLRRAFSEWGRAREWRDAVDGDYALEEVLVERNDGSTGGASSKADEPNGQAGKSEQ